MTKSRNLIRPKWQPDAAAIELVRRHYATSRTADLAEALGVAYHQVSKLAQRLGVRKDEAWLNGPQGGRTDGQRGLGTRFQPGQTPWTKGRKGIRLSPGTEFRRGQPPLNFRPVGSLRVAHCGYLQIKLQATGYPPKDWQMYHRHVWEQAHGPVPRGHVVAFKDGRRRLEPAEITLDVLECITRGEHMRRHTFHQYGPEIAAVVQLRGAITRQINRRSRGDDTTQEAA